MPAAGRIGDQASKPHDASAGHEAKGPAKQGSPDVFINGRAVLRVGDPGEGSSCCSGNQWQAVKGSRGVTVNGLPLHRVGDETKHCGGKGELIEGSSDVFVGDYGGGEPAPVPHDKSLTVELADGLGRLVNEAVAYLTCPHKADKEHPFSGTTTLSELCSGASIAIRKVLQKGTWDPGAVSGEHFPPTHAHVAAPAPAAPPPAAPRPAAPPTAPSSGPAAAAAPAPAPAPAPAGEATHVVHAPAPAATASDQSSVHLVRPTADTAKVKLTTVHNWVELVYKAFGFDLPTAATEIAILGVREASLTGKGGEDALEAELAAGETDKATETREARDPDFSHPTTFNDLLFVPFTTTTPGHEQQVEVFECTIDAGAVESELGTPITLEGKLYRGLPGSHIPSRYPGSDICLHLYSGSLGKMMLARDCTKAWRVLSDLRSARNPVTGWAWCTDEDNSSIHLHFGADAYNTVGRWSTGCTVLHHHYFIKDKSGSNVADPKAVRYKRFMALFNGAANKRTIPYLVVSSRYVRSYAEWVKLVDASPDQSDKPASVILKDRLQSPDGKPGKYIPSFMTPAFANGVTALADDKQTSAAHAANLRSSLDLSLFTLSI